MPELEYKCGHCGNPYPTIEQRTTCEMTCGAAIKKAEAEKAEAHRKAEEARVKAEKDAARKKDYEEIVSDLNAVIAKYTKFVENYGEINLQYSGRNLPTSNIMRAFEPFFSVLL